MKSLLDPTFQYVPSHKTDIEKTFERIRKQMKKQEQRQVVQPLRKKA